MKGFPDLPPIWWAGSIAVIHVAKWLLPNLHWDVAALNGALSIVSRGLFLAALFIIAWSAVWFWRKKTPIEPHHTPKTLIVEGPYTVSRNPIYLALVMLTVSSAIGHGSVIGLGCSVLLWAILDRRFATQEEAFLRQAFGDSADAYFAKTKRWL